MKVYLTLLLFCFSSIALKAKDSLSLYIFLLDDCPICIQYTPALNELYATYGDEVAFVGIFPNFSSKRTKIDAFKNTYGVQFPLQTDYYKKVARKYGATITPEVVLVNHSTDETIYQGRISNMFERLGRRRKVVTSHDLRLAIQNTLDGKAVESSYVQPVGCFINFSDNFSKNINDNND